MTGPEPVHCQVCGRKLRTKASRARGRGDTCDEKVSPTPGRDHSPRRIRVGRRSSVRAGAALPETPGQDGPDLLDVLEEQP